MAVGNTGVISKPLINASFKWKSAIRSSKSCSRHPQTAHLLPAQLFSGEQHGFLVPLCCLCASRVWKCYLGTSYPEVSKAVSTPSQPAGLDLWGKPQTDLCIQEAHRFAGDDHHSLSQWVKHMSWKCSWIYFQQE